MQITGEIKFKKGNKEQITIRISIYLIDFVTIVRFKQTTFLYPFNI